MLLVPRTCVPGDLLMAFFRAGRFGRNNGSRRLVSLAIGRKWEISGLRLISKLD